MKRIYVAGPYSCENRCNVGYSIDLEYMRQGLQVCMKLLALGYAPFCPWLDYLYRLIGEEKSYYDVHKYSIEWLKVSEAMLVIGNSPGVWKEIGVAGDLGIPIFYSIEELEEANGR